MDLRRWPRVPRVVSSALLGSLLVLGAVPLAAGALEDVATGDASGDLDNGTSTVDESLLDGDDALADVDDAIAETEGELVGPDDDPTSPPLPEPLGSLVDEATEPLTGGGPSGQADPPTDGGDDPDDGSAPAPAPPEPEPEPTTAPSGAGEQHDAPTASVASGTEGPRRVRAPDAVDAGAVVVSQPDPSETFYRHDVITTSSLLDLLPDPADLILRSPAAPWAWPFEIDNYTRQPGQRTTAELVAGLEALDVPAHVVANVLAPFPVAGPASYGDDWGAPRFVPSFHAHQGTDIFAERGTPVIASADGVISRVRVRSAVGGNTVTLTSGDGTSFYYAHLDGFAPGIVPGAQVMRGAWLGTVGDTGNALGTPPHLHYEIHPMGGAAVPPVPYLDAWLEEARAEVLMLEGPGLDANLLRPAPAPIPPATAVAGAVGNASPAASARSMTGVLTASGTANLPLLGVWVLFVLVLYVLLRRRAAAPAAARHAGPASSPVAPASAAARRGRPGPDAVDVLAPLLRADRERTLVG